MSCAAQPIHTYKTCKHISELLFIFAIFGQLFYLCIYTNWKPNRHGRKEEKEREREREKKRERERNLFVYSSMKSWNVNKFSTISNTFHLFEFDFERYVEIHYQHQSRELLLLIWFNLKSAIKSLTLWFLLIFLLPNKNHQSHDIC